MKTWVSVHWAEEEEKMCEIKELQNESEQKTYFEGAKSISSSTSGGKSFLFCGKMAVFTVLV